MSMRYEEGAKKGVLVICQLALGLLILIILLQQANFEETFKALLKADTKYVIIGSSLIIAASTMIALSFFFILSSLKYKASLSSCIQANFAGQLASDLTPGRAGYFITPFVMEALGETPFEACLVATVLSGMIDFLIRALLTIVSVAYLIGPIESISGVRLIVVLSAVILATSALCFAALLWSDKPRKLALRLSSFRIVSRVLNPYLERIEKFQRESIKAKRALGPVVLSMLSTSILDSMALYFLSLSVGVELNPGLFIFIYSLVSSFTYLPLTLAGLGVQEGVLAALLQLFGTPLSHGVSVSLLYRFFYTATDLIGLPALMKIGFAKVFNKRIKA
ncbi:MAG: flippase-like domain-containing protein [Candidatus Brockarchaeota archaeon]|nr:flippase-like domain-containing protein [Candidatus Brockarchaeota archaeon]